MNKKNISNWLRVLIAGCAVCGLAVYFWLIPSFGHKLAEANPEYAFCFWPWLIFLWLTGIPCYLAMVLAWKIAGTIQKETAFTSENGQRLRIISRLAVWDAIFLVAGSAAYWMFGMAHPGMVILSVGIGCAGGAIAVVMQALALLTDNAAALQEQSDWTI